MIVDERVPHRTALLDGVDLLTSTKLEWFRRGYLDGAADVALGNIVVEKSADGLLLRELAEEVMEDALEEIKDSSAIITNNVTN